VRTKYLTHSFFRLSPNIIPHRLPQACDDLIGPGWTFFEVKRKNGSGRVDKYYRSPAGDDQVTLRSLSSAKRHHQKMLSQTKEKDFSLNDTSIDKASVFTPSKSSTGSDSPVDTDSPIEPSKGEDGGLFDSDSDSSVSLVVSKSADTDSNMSIDSDSESSSLSYNCSLYNEPNEAATKYDKLSSDWLKKYHLSEDGNPSSILNAVAHALTLSDSNGASNLTTTKSLVKFVKNKITKKTTVPLSLLQGKAIHDLVTTFDSEKQPSLKTVRWHISALHALAKILDRDFVVISPAHKGETGVRVTRISHSVYLDLQLSDGPWYFPTIKELSWNGEELVLRAIIDFETKNVIGYKAITPELPKKSDEDVLTDEEVSRFSKGPDIIKLRGGGTQKAEDTSESPPAKNSAFTTPTKRVRNEDNDAPAPPRIKMRAENYFGLDNEGKLHSDLHLKLPSPPKNTNAKNGSGWGSNPYVLESLKKKKTSHPKTRNHKAVLEISYGITDLKTGEKVYIGIISYMPSPLWYFRSPAFNPAFQLWHKVHGPRPIEGGTASVYDSWEDIPIRRTVYGENRYQRRGRISNGQLPYPVMKPKCEIRINPKGFNIKVIATKIDADFKSMTSDGTVLSSFLFDHLEENSSSMLNNFLAGQYRKGNEKNLPFEDENELRGVFKQDIEDGFQHGFSRIEHCIHLNKYLCDYTIQQFLMSLGYNSFDELKPDEQAFIYKNGHFPEWDDITEEPMSGVSIDA